MEGCLSLIVTVMGSLWRGCKQDCDIISSIFKKITMAGVLRMNGRCARAESTGISPTGHD